MIVVEEEPRRMIQDRTANDSCMSTRDPVQHAHSSGTRHFTTSSPMTAISVRSLSCCVPVAMAAVVCAERETASDEQKKTIAGVPISGFSPCTLHTHSFDINIRQHSIETLNVHYTPHT